MGVLFGGIIGAVAGAGVRTVEWGTISVAGARVSLAPEQLGLRVRL